jgi:hypothetical protein
MVFLEVMVLFRPVVIVILQIEPIVVLSIAMFAMDPQLVVIFLLSVSRNGHLMSIAI